MITSRDNSHLKHARAVRKGQISDEIFLEGLRLCEEAIRSQLDITGVLYTSDFAVEPRGRGLLVELKNRDVELLLVPEKLLDSVTDTKTPQGIVVLAKKPASKAGHVTQHSSELPLTVIIHQMNNPSNLGAILRTAEAAGVSGIIVTKNSADPFSPKALRGAMGASLRLPLWYDVEFSAAVEHCKENKMPVACADVNGAASYADIDWRKPRALVIGSEAHGLSADELAMCDESFRIPMAGPVESLNAAVAAGIVLYEARRVAATLTQQSAG